MTFNKRFRSAFYDQMKKLLKAKKVEPQNAAIELSRANQATTNSEVFQTRA